MANLDPTDPKVKAMLDFAAQDFFNTGRTVIVEKDYVRLSEPWYISVQSLGGTVFHPEPALVLYLNLEDGFHQEQRAYANRQERSLQAAVFLTLGKSCFIKSVLGNKANPSVFSFHFISNLLALYSVQFAIRGAHYRDDMLNWDIEIGLLRIQALQSYWDRSFEKLARPLGSDPNRPGPSPDPNPDPTPPNVNPSADPNPSPDPNPPNLIVQPSISETECTVCMELLKDRVALIPCGHTTFCPECVPQLNQCPICRAQVMSKLKLFL